MVKPIIEVSMSGMNEENVKQILTFGYGNRKDYSKFMKYLEEYKITHVFDVRLKPTAWTRRWYGLELRRVCHEVNIKYVSLPSLGNISGECTWIAPDKESAQASLLKVAATIQREDSGNAMLLCAELDHARCHRTEVARELWKITNIPVKHLG